MVRSEQYRRYAQACLLLARNAEDEQARASLLHSTSVVSFGRRMRKRDCGKTIG